MATNPPKKTESAADAPPSSGVPPTLAGGSTPPSPAPSVTNAAEDAWRARERAEKQAEVEFLADLVAQKLGAAIGKAVVDALEAQKAAQRPGAFKKPPKKEVPPEYRGARQYIVGPRKAFQNGRVFQPGERITVVDQFPAADWTPVEESSAPASKQASVKQARAADQDVG